MSAANSLICESLTAVVSRLSELVEPYDPAFPEMCPQPVELFLFNVPFDATVQDVERHLGSVCKVHNCRLIERPSPLAVEQHRTPPKRKRFGFVQVASKPLAYILIDRLHQQHFMGRKLGIQISHRKQESFNIQ